MIRSAIARLVRWLRRVAGLVRRVPFPWRQRRQPKAAESPAKKVSLVDGGFWVLATLALLGVAFIAAVVAQAWQAIRETVEKTADEKVQLALEFDVAMRQYVVDAIRPEFLKRCREQEFVPEVMSSSFVARSVFDRVRQRIPDLLLRFPSTNPRNPINQATEQEWRIIRHFEQNPRAEAWSGTIEHEGKTFYARAVPRRFGRHCLHCHGDVGDAPAALVAHYGPTRGFGNTVGDVSIDLAGVSVTETLADAWGHLRFHMVLAGGLAVLFLGGSAAAIWLDAQRRRRTAETLKSQRDELSRERAKLQAIFDSVQVGLLLVDEQTRVVRVNDVVAKLVGRSGDELLHRQPGDGLCCIHASESPEGCGHAEACGKCVTRKTIATVLAEGRPIRDVETALQLHVGGQRKSFWTSLSATPLELEGKKHVLLAVVDVSQRKEAEQRYRALFESSCDALMTLAPPDWRFTSCNPATLALFGMGDEAEFTASRIWDLAPRTQPDGRDSAEKALERIETAMREGADSFEWTHKRRDGREFPATVALTRVEVGDAAFLQATVRDVTAQKESERKQREYASALERQKTESVSSN